MFESVKRFFNKAPSVDKPIPVDAVAFQAQPIEVNPTPERVVGRNEARLARLLTIKNPSDEIKAEITRLQGK